IGKQITESFNIIGFNLLPLPASITDPAVRELLEKYYEHSNNTSEHEEVANLFTTNGEYAMNGKASKGRDSTDPNI
ncbi:MAG: hypothetical protein Q9164_007745, partial [Protoblastenia rupestris]